MDDLYDVIISAPEIKIEKGFKGRVHLFASKKIALASEINLLFPSTLWVHHTASEIKDDVAIEVHANTQINAHWLHTAMKN